MYVVTGLWHGHRREVISLPCSRLKAVELRDWTRKVFANVNVYRDIQIQRIMRIYISGKIGGEVISEATRQKFAEAEQMLRARGFVPFNPCSEEWQAHLKVRYKEDRKTYQPYIDGGGMPDFYTYALLRDAMALSVKEAIYMLPDFLDSKGAKFEHAFAIATGKQVYYADELFTDGTLRPKEYQKNRLPEVAP